MSMDLDKLKHKRAEAVRRQRELLDAADAEKRELTADETREYNELDQKFDLLTKIIEEETPSSARQHCMDQLSELETRGHESKGGNMNVLFDYRNDQKLEDELRAVGATFAATSDEEMRANTLQKDLDYKGGLLVLPTEMTTKVWHAMDSEVFIRQYATIFNIPRADGARIPTMDSDMSDMEWTGEITEASLGTMSFGARNLVPHRLSKGLKVSRDLIRLGAPDVGNFVSSRGIYKLNLAQETAFMTGDGVGKPLGVFTESDDGVSSSRNVSTGNTTTAVKADGLINCMYSLKSQYLRSKSCFWIFHRDVLKAIRKLKDGEGNYLWASGLAGEPATILGIPYILSELAPSTMTSGSRVGLIGDLSFYGIAQHWDISVQVLTEKYALENATGYIFQMHADGGPLIEEAFSMVTLA
jgi:HK97 family phage major capsid protein